MRRVREFIAFADGSADNSNKSPASVGVCVGIKRGNRAWIVMELAKCIGPGTNNVAELVAIQCALRGLAAVGGYRVRAVVYTDSRYAMHMIDGLYKNRSLSKNFKLVNKIKCLFGQFLNVKFKHVYGHSGVEGNELVDWLADLARNKQWNYEPAKWTKKLNNRPVPVDFVSLP